MTQRIIVGVDGSETSTAAVAWGVHEAQRRSWPLHLLSCYTVPVYGELAFVANDVNAKPIIEAHQHFVDAAASLCASLAPTVEVSTDVVLDSPVYGLTRVADYDDVLVVGSAGHTGVIADTIGSVATGVVHHAPCPVVVVHPKAGKEPGLEMRKIVVGVDGSPSSDAAVQWAIDEAHLSGADVSMVHGWTYPYSWHSADGLLHDAMERDAEEQLRASASVADSARRSETVSILPELVPKSPANALISVADDADLLVVGSRGRGGFAAMLLGSVSRTVIQHATCPVAVIRSHDTH
jgi:nucleotide-binding universal stress UspA family protein